MDSMGKRFTETNKWSDKWFRKLSPSHKMAWCYLTDCCDQAGIIDLDEELANFQIGVDVDWSDFIEQCGERIRTIHKGKLFLTGFIKFQYGKLSPECKPHMPVIQLLERHGISIESVEQNDAYKYGKVDAGKRAKVYQRDGHVCCYCGERFAASELEPDHVIPVSRGGNDAIGNLVAACFPCNRAKFDRHPTEFINSLPNSSDAWKRLSQRVTPRLYESLQDTEQDKDKEKEQEKEKETDKDKEGGVGGTEFAAWWSTVPNKVGKQAAAKAYRNAIRNVRGRTPLEGEGGGDPHGFLLARMLAFAQSPKAKGQYCPHPATWLNEGRYDDDPETWKSKHGQRSDIGPAQRFDESTVGSETGF